MKLLDGDYHAINEICNAWLEIIIQIAGGTHNIPNDEKKRISEIVGKSRASVIYSHFHPKIEP